MQLAGRTPCDRIVVFDGNPRQIGNLLPVRVYDANAFTLFGSRRDGARRAGSLSDVATVFRLWRAARCRSTNPTSRRAWMIATVQSMLDSPDRCGQRLRRVRGQRPARGHCELAADRHLRRHARPGRRLCRSVGRASAAADRPRSGAEQPGPLFRRGAQPAVAGVAVRARSAGAADSAGDFRHQPASERLADHGPRGVRPVADDRRPAGRARGARRGNRARGERPPTDERSVADGAAAVQKPRNAANLLRRPDRSGSDLETVTEQISYLADALVEAAVRSARAAGTKSSAACHAAPGGDPAKFVVLALGKLGGAGAELFERHRPDLSCTTATARPTASGGDRMANFSTRWPATSSAADRSDASLARRIASICDCGRKASRAAGAMSLESALHYYDVLGRTWERQAMVKARPVAGDLDLGQEFLAQLEPWIYRRYLSRADITGIKALKRRIEQRAAARRGRRPQREDRPRRHSRYRVRHSVPAIAQRRRHARAAHGQYARRRSTGWRKCGCLTDQERSILADNYRVSAKDRTSSADHVRPANPRHAAGSRRAAEAGHSARICRRRRNCRRAKPLPSRLSKPHRAEPANSRSFAARRVSATTATPSRKSTWCSTPNRGQKFIRSVLGKHGFQDIPAAYANLMRWPTSGSDSCPRDAAGIFWRRSLRGCSRRSPQTPDPDSTLVNLANVSDSLGGKGVLWELFSFNPPSLRLYVELCASSPYLSEILTSNPGMIDELMDSLLLGQAAGAGLADAATSPSCARAPRTSSRSCTASRTHSNCASACATSWARKISRTRPRRWPTSPRRAWRRSPGREYASSVEKFGQPTVDEGDRGRAAERIRDHRRWANSAAASRIITATWT